jgi:hypothetical protein
LISSQIDQNLIAPGDPYYISSNISIVQNKSRSDPYIIDKKIALEISIKHIFRLEKFKTSATDTIRNYYNKINDIVVFLINIKFSVVNFIPFIFNI